MHPVFANSGLLRPYLAVSLPLAGLLTVLLALPGEVGWAEAAALALPLALGFAFLGLSTWYVCRAAPLGQAGALRLLATHGAGAAALTAVWILLARILASGLALRPAWSGLAERLGPSFPLLMAVGVLLYVVGAAFHYLLLAFEAEGDAERRAAELRLQAREAELRALEAQVNPHFLFNSLNSIAALAGSDPSRAREMCALLSDLLRRSLSRGARDEVSLGEELELAAAYLAVEKVRFGDRLAVEGEVDPACRDQPVPPLILQPLIENAITHGLSGLSEGGVLRLDAGRRGGRLRLVIENPYDPQGPSRRGAGLGLENVRRRLAVRYGGEASLKAEAREGLFRVDLTLPCAGEEVS